MIISVVQLPSLTPPGSEIFGEMMCDFSMQPAWELNVGKIFQGRNLIVRPGLTRYKLQIQDVRTPNCNPSIFDVILVASKPFNPDTLLDENKRPVRIYPLYWHKGSECFINIQNVNQLFHDHYMVSRLGTDVVLSPGEFLSKIDERIGRVGPARDVDFRWSYCAVSDRVVDLLTAGYGPDTLALDGIKPYGAYQIPYGYQPKEVEFIMGTCTMSTDLANYISGNQVKTDVKRASIGWSQSWDKLRFQLNMPNTAEFLRSADVYMTDPEDISSMGRVLSLIYQQMDSDFIMPFRLGGSEDPNLHYTPIDCLSGFTKGRPVKYYGDDLQGYLIRAISLYSRNLFGTDSMPAQPVEYRLHKTWTEDLFIYNEFGRIILHIDLVWFMLACCEGLINYNSLTCIEGLYNHD